MATWRHGHGDMVMDMDDMAFGDMDIAWQQPNQHALLQEFLLIIKINVEETFFCFMLAYCTVAVVASALCTARTLCCLTMQQNVKSHQQHQQQWTSLALLSAASSWPWPWRPWRSHGPVLPVAASR